MKTILILNGPNLNLLGRREPEIYGHATLNDAVRLCAEVVGETYQIQHRQSNHEGQLVDWIQEAEGVACGIAINAGAYTHTSIAILDALKSFNGPVMEVHVSQIFRREAFRHHSYISPRADGVIAGLGLEGYAAACRRIVQLTTDT